MTFIQACFLFLAALLSGILNSVAGGGGLIVFPALLIAALPSISANATSTLASWPGSIASIGAYRQELQAIGRLSLLFGSVSLVGGMIGAMLLLHTPTAMFEQLVPYLLLLATLLFTCARCPDNSVACHAWKSRSRFLAFAAQSLIRPVFHRCLWRILRLGHQLFDVSHTGDIRSEAHSPDECPENAANELHRQLGSSDFCERLRCRVATSISDDGGNSHWWLRWCLLCPSCSYCQCVIAKFLAALTVSLAFQEMLQRNERAHF